MTAREFFDLVAAMREQQIEWFTKKNPIALQKSKDLEKEVDKEIYRVNCILNNKPQPVQGELFAQ